MIPGVNKKKPKPVESPKSTGKQKAPFWPDNPIVGFTGTREGMTKHQKRGVRKLLKQLKPRAVHHGDCIGADFDFHVIACSLNISVIKHPPEKPDTWKNARNFSVSWKPAPYFVRDRALVDESHIVIACPKQMTEQDRGGTWYTYRYAKKVGKVTRLILPKPVAK